MRALPGRAEESSDMHTDDHTAWAREAIAAMLVRIRKALVLEYLRRMNDIRGPQ